MHLTITFVKTVYNRQLINNKKQTIYQVSMDIINLIFCMILKEKSCHDVKRLKLAK